MAQFSQMQAAFNAAVTVTEVSKLIGEVRDRLEIVHTSEFANFMHHLFPILRDLIVIKTSPQFEDNAENRVRHSLLEIFNKFPNNETLKPYVYEIMILSLKVLADDNEENAIIALKVIFDLHKSYRPSLEQYILPFLETVNRIYANMPAASQAIFRGASVPPAPTSPPATNLVRSVESFKVLTECPIIVMLLFQFYPRFVGKTMTQMVPVMLNTLSLNPIIDSNTNAVIPQQLQQRQRYREFLAAQVKTLSFLTFLLRSYSDFLKTFEPSIVKSVMMLLQRCPEESVGTRKELLIATRHILATDLRRGFVPYLDDLLEDSLFLGPGQPTVLRPVAYSTIGDLVNHVKDTLSLTQIIKVINTFTLNIQDLTLPVNLHVAAVRVLLTLVDRLQHSDLGEENISTVQYLLHHVFRNMVEKLGVLRLHVEEAYDLEERVKTNASYLQEREAEESQSGSDSVGDISHTTGNTVANTPTRSSTFKLPNTSAVYLFLDDPAIQEQTVRDLKGLVRTILGGMKVCCQAIQTIDQAAKVALGHPSSSLGSLPSSDKVLAANVGQMAVVKDHIASLACLFQFAVECGAYFLAARSDRLSYCQCMSATQRIAAQGDQRLRALSLTQPDREDERLSLSGTCAVEASEYVATIAAPFMLLEPRNLAQVLYAVLGSFIGSSSPPKGNHFFTAVIEMLLSYTPSVNLVGLETVFTLVLDSIDGYRTASSSTSRDGVAFSMNYAFERKSPLRRIFTAAIESLQRFPENDSALASRLNALIGDILGVAILLPPRHLKQSDCLHFLRLLFRALHFKHLRLSILSFRSLFPKVLHSLKGLLDGTELSKSDPGVQCEVLSLICSLPLDVTFLPVHLPSLLKHILSALKLTGLGAGLGELYRLALLMFESCVDMLPLEVMRKVMEADPFTAGGLFAETSRHLKPKPYPLSDISCHIMGKLGCCHAFARAPQRQDSRQEQGYMSSVLEVDRDSVSIIVKSNLLSKSRSDPMFRHIPLGMDAVIKGACEVFESSSSSFASDVKEIPFALRKEDKLSSLEKGNAKGLRSSCLGGSKGNQTLTNDTDNDLSVLVLDNVTLQKENAHLVETFRLEHRLDALCVLEGALTSLLSPLKKDNHCQSNICANEIFVFRSILSRVLCAIHWACLDPCLGEKSLEIVESVCNLLCGSDRNIELSSESPAPSSILLDNAVDSVHDSILSSLQGCGANGSECDFQSDVTYRLLRAWLNALSDGKEEEGRYRTPCGEPFVTQLVVRCTVVCGSDSRRERVAATHALHGLCSLLPKGWLTSQVGIIVGSLMSTLEYPSNLMCQWEMEGTLEALKAVITSCYIRPSSHSSLTLSVAGDDATSKDEFKQVAKDTQMVDGKCTTVESELLFTVVPLLFHPCSRVRVGAGHFLKEVSRTLGEEVSTIMLPARELIADLMERRFDAIGETTGDLDHGLVSGLTYYCNLKPPLVTINIKMFSVLNAALNATEEEVILAPLSLSLSTVGFPPSPFIRDLDESCLMDDLLLGLKSNPFPIPPAVIRRLLFIRLTHALCTAASASSNAADSMLLKENKDTLQRSFQLLFKALASCWEGIGLLARKALHLLVGLKASPSVSAEAYEVIFPRDLMQRSLQPLLLPLSNFRKLSIGAIRGIESVLRLVTNGKFLQFGEKILEHLRLFLEPERLVGLQLWGEEGLGVEEQIASGLLGLLPLLPWLPASNSSLPVPVNPGGALSPSPTSTPRQVLLSFLYNCATTVSDLDQAWRRFRPTPSLRSIFIPPFAKLLSRFPEEAVLFFFSAERILDREVCELLLRVLDSGCPASKQLADRLASRDNILLLSQLSLSQITRKKSERKEDGEKGGVSEISTTNGIAGDSGAAPGSESMMPLSVPPIIAPKEEVHPNVDQGGEDVLVPPMEDEPAEQRNAALLYNALRIIKKLSEKSPHILYSNHQLLSTLTQLVPQCQASNESTTSKHILLTSLLSFSSYSLHQRATIAMENAYRNAHQLSLLSEILIGYCRLHPYPTDADSLLQPGRSQLFEDTFFSLAPVLTMKSCILDFTFLLDFYRSEVPFLCSSSHARKRIIRKTFNLVASKREKVALKVKLVQVIALPLLLKIFLCRDISTGSSSSGKVNSRSSSEITHIFDAEMIQLIMQDVIGMSYHGVTASSFSSSSSSTSTTGTGGEGLERINSQDQENKMDTTDALKDGREDVDGKEVVPQDSGGGLGNDKSEREAGGDKDSSDGNSDSANFKIELLKLSTLCLERLSPLFKLYKKDVIKFAWNNVKAEGNATRHWAYINICRFVSSFDSPPKIIIQVYVALLRSFQPEGKELIRRALDILVPVLSARLLPEDFYKAVKWTKKILADEGYSMPQLCHIWHMVIRFSDVFYPYRSQLVPQMLNAITRIGLSANVAPEFRLVAVAIADLVIGWEVRSPNKARAPSIPSISGGPSPLPSPPIPLTRKRPLSEDITGSVAVSGLVGDKESEEAVKKIKVEVPQPQVVGSAADITDAGILQKRSDSQDLQLSDTRSQSSDIISAAGGVDASVTASVTFKVDSGTDKAKENVGSSNTAGQKRPSSTDVVIPGVTVSLADGLASALSSGTLNPNPPNNSEGADESYTLPRALVQTLANFVMRLCFFAADSKDTAVSCLSPRCLRLFEKMSNSLPAMGAVPLPYFERLLQNALESYNAKAPAPSDSVAANTAGSAPVDSISNTLASTAAPQGQASSSSSSRNHPSSSSSSASKAGFSDTLLSFFLDVTSSSLLCRGGPNQLFEQSAYLLKDLHGPVFASDSAKVHESYKRFLKTVLAVYPCSLSVPTPLETSGFLYQLVGALSLGLKVKVSCLREAQSLLLLLQSVSAVCRQQIRLVENFGSALLRIGHLMLGDHMQRTLTRAAHRRKSRTGLSETRTDIPCKVFNEESCLTTLLTDAATTAVPKSGGKGKGDAADLLETRAREREEGGSSSPLDDLSGKILTCCLCVLFQSIDSGYLEQQRPAIVSLLAAVVEGADNMLLINLASKYCLRWVGLPSSPLSLGEQVMVFNRICCHSGFLQANCKQAVLARFAAVSERIGGVGLESQTTSNLQQSSSRKSFSNCDNKLGSLALLSPVKTMRRACQRRILNTWGPSLFERLKGILSLDLIPQFHSQWPFALASLALDNSIETQIESTEIRWGSTLAVTNNGHDWLRAVSDFTLSRPDVGKGLFQVLLQAMWRELDQEGRDELALALANNILQAKHLHPISTSVDTCAPSNRRSETIPLLLLQMFSQLLPIPCFPVEFLSSLGPCGCEGEVVALLEAKMGSCRSENETRQVNTALLASLDRLDDRDVATALLRSCSTSGATDLALSLEMYDRCDLAQNVILQAISSSPSLTGNRNLIEEKSNSVLIDIDSISIALDATSSTESVADAESLARVRDRAQGEMVLSHLESYSQIRPEEESDLELWECRWIKYARELSQWSTLSTFAAAAGAADLSLESSVMLGDWEGARRIRGTPAFSSSLLSGGGRERGEQAFKLRFFDGMLGLLDRRYPEAGEALLDATQLALCRWQQIPKGNIGPSCCHAVLSSLQHLQELDEGKGMLLSAQSCSTARVLPDFSGKFGVWRDRLPDRAESMLKWDPLLLWRSHLFGAVTRILRGVHDESRLIALGDAPWTALQLVGQARRQGLLNLGLRASLHPLLQSSGTMGVTDAFSKVREQVLLCLSSRDKDSAEGGLNIVNTTNLDFFGPEQRAEMFRLKGLCNRQLGQHTEAQDCFSRGVQLCGGSRARDWMSWGHLCYDLWEETSGAVGKKIAPTPATTSPDHALSALVCLLKAVECGSSTGRMLLPRILWMLEYSLAVTMKPKEKQCDPFVECFVSQMTTMPALLGVWLPHLSSLLGFFCRKGGEPFFPLLQALLSKYPQVLIGVLLPSSDKNTGSANSQVAEDSSLDRLEGLRQLAKRSHSTLWMRMSWLGTAVRQFSKPCAAEAMLERLQALCEAHMNNENGDDIRRKLLIDDIDACLNPSLNVSLELDDCRCEGDESILRALSDDFGFISKEKGDSSDLECFTFYQILSKLHKWTWCMSSHCKDKDRHAIGLGSNVSFNNFGCGISSITSRTPSRPFFYNYFDFEGGIKMDGSLDMPLTSQRFMTSGPHEEDTASVKVVRVSRSNRLMQGVKSRGRGVQLLGSDGHMYSFSVSSDKATDAVNCNLQGQFSSFASVANWALQQHLPSRGRALRGSLLAPLGVCIGGGVTITAELGGMCSLEDIYLRHCAERHENPHWLAVRALEYMQDGDMDASLSREEKMQLMYNNACSLVSPTVLRDLFTSSSKSLAEAYSVRKAFASQLGLNAAVQHLLSAPSLSPRQLIVCPHTGRLASLGVAPSLKSSDGDIIVAEEDEEDEKVTIFSTISKTDTVPFRLTRNIVGALSGPMLLGATAVSLGCSLDAFLANRDVIDASLSLMLCDVSRARQRQRGVGDSENSLKLSMVKAMTARLLADIEAKLP